MRLRNYSNPILKCFQETGLRKMMHNVTACTSESHSPYLFEGIFDLELELSGCNQRKSKEKELS